MWTVSLLACGLSTATNSTPDSTESDGATVFQHACSLSLEGIVGVHLCAHLDQPGDVVFGNACKLGFLLGPPDPGSFIEGRDLQPHSRRCLVHCKMSHKMLFCSMRYLYGEKRIFFGSASVP
jgi:hypothetical protein